MTDEQPRVIRQSRDKLSYLVIGSVVAVVGSAFTGSHPGERYDPSYYQVIGWGGAAFFGFAGAMGITQLYQPSELVLAPDGLIWVGPWWRRSWRWGDISPFEVIPVAGTRTKMIFFDGPRANGQQVRTAMSGPARNSIPGLWQIPLPELCDTLNAARERWR